jgi:hypothetical protein
MAKNNKNGQNQLIPVNITKPIPLTLCFLIFCFKTVFFIFKDVVPHLSHIRSKHSLQATLAESV